MMALGKREERCPRCGLPRSEWSENVEGYARIEHLYSRGDCADAIRGAVDQARSHPASRAPPCLRVPVRFILLGVGAMNSPRYAPAGLLVEHGDIRVMIDGGPGAEPPGTIDAWLVTDDRGELIRQIRQLARARGLTPQVARFHRDGLVISPEPVVHTSHPTYGYLIAAEGRKVVWAPEFLEFPRWAEGADVMFAEAAGWNRPIRFARGAGGHAAALQVAREAREHGVRKLVFAHIGRPTIKALDAGLRPPFGEIGHDGAVFTVTGSPP